MTTEPVLSESTPASEAIVDVLVEAGIDMVFGLRGGHMSKLLRGLAVRTDSVRYVPVRQETLTTPMAET